MKKTVLFINGHLDVGGCERSLVDILKNFDYEEYDVDLLLLEHKGDYFDEVPKEVNVTLYSLDYAFGSFISCMIKAIIRKDWFSFFFRFYYILGNKVDRHFWRKLKKLFKKVRDSYDIIIAYRPGICTELAAFTFHGKKKISWWHHGCMNFSGKSADVLEMSYRQMDSIVAVSSSSALLVAKKFPVIKSKIKVIPNMIVSNELYIKSKRFEPKEFQKSGFKIISVGRMSPEKNMIQCPYIAYFLKVRGIKFKWILIGDGAEEQKVKNAIKQLDLQDDVIMIGRKSNPYPYIAIADLLVHPSLVESQGITLLESMVLKTPVVTVASQGPQEFVKSGVNGYLVENDVEKIAKKIEMLYTNTSLRLQIIENAAEDVQRFESKEIMGKIQEVLV